jgi:Peptidase A4 family
MWNTLASMRFLKLAGAVVAACTLAWGVAVPVGATTSPYIRSASSPTWAGYAGTPPKGKTIREINVTFVVPQVKCSGSIGAPEKGKYPGWHASFWAGIDGWNPTSRTTNGTVQQAGVIAFCRTRKSVATYRAFYEMFPASPVLTKQVVQAGNELTVYVSVTRKTYTFGFNNMTSGTNFTATATCAEGTTCHNATAEVITEAPGGGPDAGHGLADTGTVSYTNAAVSLQGEDYGFALGQLATVTKITMSPTGYPGIVRPSKLSGEAGPSNFMTYWK